MALDKLTKVQSVGISSFIQVVGVVTATQGFDGNITGIITATGDFSIADKIVHTGDTDTAIRFPAANVVTIESGGSEAFRVHSDGKIGIGTAVPSELFTVYSPINGVTASIEANTTRAYDSATLKFLGGNLSTNTLQFGDATVADVGKIVYNHDGNSLAFTVNSSERLRITSSGSVGIGTDNPSVNLQVKGSASNGQIYLGGTGAHSQIYADNDGVLILNADQGNSAANSYLSFNVDNSERVRIDSSGNAILKTANGAFKSENPNSSGDYVRMYAGAGTAQWDIYGNGELLRMSENSGNSAARVQFDLPTTHRSTSTTTGIAALTAQQEVNNGGYLIFDGKNSSGTSVFNVTHNGRVRVSDGIDFSANSHAAGMTSEVLNDYEEGTWTPELLGGSSNPSLTYSAQSGGYEKIGNLVHLSFFMNVSAVNSQGSGYLELHGLPYTPVTSPLGASEVPALVLQTQPFADGKAANRFAFVRTVGGSSRMFVGYRDLTNGNAIIPTQGAGNISTGYFIGHITYRAS